MSKLERDKAMRALQDKVGGCKPQSLPVKPRRPKGAMRPRATLSSIMHCSACGAVGNAGPTCEFCGEVFKRR